LVHLDPNFVPPGTLYTLYIKTRKPNRQFEQVQQAQQVPQVQQVQQVQEGTMDEEAIKNLEENAEADKLKRDNIKDL
jgi:hypothetical protein